MFLNRFLCCSFFIASFLQVNCSFAMTWQDMWLTAHQQGVMWYREGAYEKAYNFFTRSQDANGFYNQGNALVHLRKYQEAIKAYNKALSLDPLCKDASYNLAIVDKLLKQKNMMQSDTSNRTSSSTQKSAHKATEYNETTKKSATASNEIKMSDNNERKEKRFAKESKENVRPRSVDFSQGDYQLASQQANQWLNSISDEPGGLLKKKFLRDHQRYETGASGETACIR